VAALSTARAGLRGMTALDDTTFDQIADDELHHLERALGAADPDELEADLASGVLTLTLGTGDKIVINSHRAAGEIWMAAFRQAWHFRPHSNDGNGWTWRTQNGADELRQTLTKQLTGKLTAAIKL
jgi:CyaY protein